MVTVNDYDQNGELVGQHSDNKKYQIIYADPPWKQAKGGKKKVRPISSGEPLAYATMPLERIENIIEKARNLCDDDHVLFLWTIDKYLFEAEHMANRLGYKLHARMIWNKVTGIPAAFTIRYGQEYLIYCYHGKLLPVAKEQRGKWHSVFTEQVKRHSQKPEIAYQIIESLYPDTNKLELFARAKRTGWDVWGNEVDNSIELFSAAQNQSLEFIEETTIGVPQKVTVYKPTRKV